MTRDEMQAACDALGVPYRLEGEDQIYVADRSQLPGAVAEYLRLDGYLRASGRRHIDLADAAEDMPVAPITSKANPRPEDVLKESDQATREPAVMSDEPAPISSEANPRPEDVLKASDEPAQQPGKMSDKPAPISSKANPRPEDTLNAGDAPKPRVSRKD